MSQNKRPTHNTKNKHAETEIKRIMPFIIILTETKYLGSIVKTCRVCTMKITKS